MRWRTQSANSHEQPEMFSFSFSLENGYLGLHHSPQNIARPNTTLPISGSHPTVVSQNFPCDAGLPPILALDDARDGADDFMSAVASCLVSKNGDPSFASRRGEMAAIGDAIAVLESQSYLKVHCDDQLMCRLGWNGK
jgi:hypothetical protein